MQFAINYRTLEKLGNEFGVSSSESAAAIGRRRRGDFIVHAADDLCANRVPPRNQPYQGDPDYEAAKRGPVGNPDYDAQKRGGRATTFSDDDADMSSGDHVDAALNAIDFEDPDALERAAEHLKKAAAKKRGAQHLRR